MHTGHTPTPACKRPGGGRDAAAMPEGSEGWGKGGRSRLPAWRRRGPRGPKGGAARLEPRPGQPRRRGHCGPLSRWAQGSNFGAEKLLFNLNRLKNISQNSDSRPLSMGPARCVCGSFARPLVFPGTADQEASVPNFRATCL